jgi:hypothetical protein
MDEGGISQIVSHSYLRRVEDLIWELALSLRHDMNVSLNY